MGKIDYARERISELSEGKKLSKSQRKRIFKQAWKEAKARYD